MFKSSQEGLIPFQPPNLSITCHTFYKIFGSLDTGATPVFMLHGGPGTGHENLTTFAGLWEQYGVPVVLYDQIGCAASTHLPQTAGDHSFWTEELFVAELDNLVDHLQLRSGFHIFGHSWGGMLGAAYASGRPAVASFKSNLRGLQEIRLQLPAHAQAILVEAEKKDDWVSPLVKEVLATLSKKHVCRAATTPPELLPTWKHLSEDKTVYRSMYAVCWIAPNEGSLATWSVIPRLPQIVAPTLVYNGEFDTSHDITAVPFFELIPQVR